MMVLWREKLAFLAVPKTGTTAIEAVLEPHAAIAYRRPPMVKHMTLQRFNRFMRPYLSAAGLGDVQTMAVMREPVDWLGSWYRYRQRQSIKNSRKSTAGLSFDAFVAAYLSDHDRPEFAEVGSQARFLSGGASHPTVDHLFRYDDLAAVQVFLQAKLGADVAFAKVNISPKTELTLSAELLAAYRKKHAADFDLYASLSR